MIRFVTLIHRWVGGLCGLLLTILGLSGALLVYKDAWTVAAHKDDPYVLRSQALGQIVQKTLNTTDQKVQSISFASPEFTLHRIAYSNGHGAYLDQTGATVATWKSDWGRPELWLVTLHRYFLVKPSGEIWVGTVGFLGLFLTVSGIVSWWRTRNTFEPRLWPKRFSRPALLRYHKDSGILVTPLLLLSLVTGVAMAFKPVASFLLGPGSNAAITRALKAPGYPAVIFRNDLDWQKMMDSAGRVFPQAQFRSLALPRKGSGLVVLRMRQPAEWLPNGRTMVWFAADTGKIVAVRDATLAPAQARGFNMLFPLHAGKMAGALHRLFMAVSGVVLALLGAFSCWTFWFSGGRKTRHNKARVDI